MCVNKYAFEYVCVYIVFNMCVYVCVYIVNVCVYIHIHLGA